MTVDRAVGVIVDAGRSALPAHLATRRRRPTQIMPALRPIAIGLFQSRRWLRWHLSRTRFARTRSHADLPFVVFRHSSALLRPLGQSEMWLQYNKVTNIKLAAPHLDAVLIRPGETLSFCRRVGRTTRRKGYITGMMLDAGQTVPGVGGGICQIANVLHWLVLHSPLTVTERSTHSEDPFPDDGRTVPWGTGCTVFYNYVDLQVRNDTADTYQVRLRVSATHLEAALLCSSRPRVHYRVYARGECYLRVDGTLYRTNEIWRDVVDESGHADAEKLATNTARTLYPVEPSRPRP